MRLLSYNRNIFKNKVNKFSNIEKKENSELLRSEMLQSCKKLTCSNIMIKKNLSFKIHPVWQKIILKVSFF
ncbi:MAG: hypothetical protein B6D45_02480 [Ignavibacteriales bacterium UTCHB3]|nr:MAG: hypothetical protein B6D45_02480 [Ignavibacteriales bacterium UTCHB3]